MSMWQRDFYEQPENASWRTATGTTGKWRGDKDCRTQRVKRKPMQPEYPPPTKRRFTDKSGDGQQPTRMKPTPKRRADPAAEAVVDLTSTIEKASDNTAKGMTPKAKPKAKAMPATSPATSFVDEVAWRLLLPSGSNESTSSSTVDTLTTNVTPDLTAAEAAEVVNELVVNTDQHAETVLQELTAEWEAEGGMNEQHMEGGGKHRPRGTKYRAGRKVQFIRLKQLLKQIRDSAEAAMRS